jgi:hypothetical protein
MQEKQYDIIKKQVSRVDSYSMYCTLMYCFYYQLLRLHKCTVNILAISIICVY